MENGPLEMGIFYYYVSLPEGNPHCSPKISGTYNGSPHLYKLYKLYVSMDTACGYGKTHPKIAVHKVRETFFGTTETFGEFYRSLITMVSEPPR